jgi:hypothetical protein
MSSLTKKLIKGRAYYYLRECRRVNGKPKIVWQEYIGTPQQLALRLTNPKPKEIVVREFGASTAAFDIAQQLQVVSLRIPVMLSSYSIRSCPLIPGMLSTPSERSDAGC